MSNPCNPEHECCKERPALLHELENARTDYAILADDYKQLRLEIANLTAERDALRDALGQQISHLTAERDRYQQTAKHWWERNAELRADLERLTAERDALHAVLRKIMDADCVPSFDVLADAERLLKG